VREKIETYKRMREEISSLRAELVILQRTETILRSRDKNLDSFLRDLEKKKGIEVKY
jgi:intraflagellar transport protein 81